MAKPKNMEERNRIERIAFRILTDKGVSNTSFADIASRAGVTRSLVQHYFPKKDIFIEDFINRCLTEISKIVEDSKLIDDTDPIERIYAVGYLQFEFLLYNRQMENLKQDILRSRDNTKLIVDDVIKWVDNYLGDEPDELKDTVAEAICYAMGGAFEHIYSCLEDGRPVDGDRISEQVIRMMNASLGYSKKDAISVPQKFPKDWVTEQIRSLNKKLLG